MIPAFILNWVVRKFGAKFAKPLIYGAAALLLVLAVWGAFKLHDSRIIATHDAKQDAANSKADRKADNSAAVQRRTDDARLTNETQQLTEAQHGATSDLDRRLAFQRCLRLQQSARRDGKQSPSCAGLGVPARSTGTH